MANINVGEVNLEGGRYQVILKKVAAAATVTAGTAMDNPVMDPSSGDRTLPQGKPAAGGRRKSKKEKKAKGTRKLSPYMKFAQEARKNILADDPSLKSDIIAVGKRIGEKWRALSDAEKARY